MNHKCPKCNSERLSISSIMVDKSFFVVDKNTPDASPSTICCNCCFSGRIEDFREVENESK